MVVFLLLHELLQLLQVLILLVHQKFSSSYSMPSPPCASRSGLIILTRYESKQTKFLYNAKSPRGGQL